uniref:Toll-like recptor 8 n=1 Tax=Oncomelania hupensis TaxID=56141 RepID=A0A2H4HI00_9CAEN|nr:toll-like recptor 8 [Oncomelania hupensis]
MATMKFPIALLLLMTCFRVTSAAVTSSKYDKSHYGFMPSDMTCKTLYTRDVSAKATDCFQHMCCCTQTVADCSGNGENLTFIPSLPSSIRFLNFSTNAVLNVTEDFFANVTGLVSVDLSNTNLLSIHPNAFRRLRKLKVLFLSHNANLTTAALQPVFDIRRLQCVDLRYGTLQALPDNLFKANALPDFQAIFLHANDIEVVNMTLFKSLPSLTTLAWGLNDVYHLTSAPMPELDTLDLFSNRLVKFPETCAEDGVTSLFPKLRILDLMKNKLDSIPTSLCLPSLKDLDLGGNYFPHLYTDMFRPQLFPSLEHVFLEYIGTRVESIKPFAFRHPNLTMISLMYNDIDFTIDNQYSDDAFAGCPKLTVLQMSHNYFTEVTDQRFLRLFGRLSNLETLYMGGAGLQQISLRTFASFPRLKVLELYQNKVGSVPEGAFDHNPELYELQLNENRIPTVTEATFSQKLRDQFTWLDLSGNPFSCDCDLRWFSAWLRNNNTAFSHAWTTYNCSNVDQLPVERFTLPDQACMLDHWKLNIIIAVNVIVIIVIVAFSLLFRFQWLLRLRLYELFRGSSDVRRRIIQSGNFDFDVFVCYSSRDKNWVVSHLLPELEVRLKLKLCLHERDFVLGKHIVDNIVECVEHSKKILLVFSKDFLLSSWCQFELAVCLQHVLDCNDALIAICVDDVVTRDLTSSMKAVMSTMTYIQWEGGVGGLQFWGRVERALQDILPTTGPRSAIGVGQHATQRSHRHRHSSRHIAV